VRKGKKRGEERGGRGKEERGEEERGGEMGRNQPVTRFCNVYVLLKNISKAYINLKKTVLK
jgi:hypothetical protein